MFSSTSQPTSVFSQWVTSVDSLEATCYPKPCYRGLTLQCLAVGRGLHDDVDSPEEPVFDVEAAMMDVEPIIEGRDELDE